MLQFHTNRNCEGVREALRRLVAGDELATGEIDGDTFQLRPKPRRRSVTVTFYGRITPERDGTLVSAWPFPHWAIIIWYPVWAWSCLALDHGALWFVVLGFIVGIISFIIETSKGYQLIRKNVA